MTIKDFTTVSLAVSSPEEEEAFREIEQRLSSSGSLSGSVPAMTMAEHQLEYNKNHPREKSYTTRSFP